MRVVSRTLYTDRPLNYFTRRICVLESRGEDRPTFIVKTSGTEYTIKNNGPKRTSHAQHKEGIYKRVRLLFRQLVFVVHSLRFFSASRSPRAVFIALRTRTLLYRERVRVVNIFIIVVDAFVSRFSKNLISRIVYDRERKNGLFE